jgi:hypothetical protein
MRSSATRASLRKHDDRRESKQVYLTLAHRANQSVITDDYADRGRSGGRTYVCQLPFAAREMAIKRRDPLFADYHRLLQHGRDGPLAASTGGWLLSRSLLRSRLVVTCFAMRAPGRGSS